MEFTPFNIPFQNITGEIIPGFAVMTSEGGSTGCNEIDGQNVLVMSKPRVQYDRIYYVNGPVPVPPNQFGNCSLGLHTIALWNDSLSWRAGLSCGPKPDDWGLWVDYPGFRILGGGSLAGQTYVLVRQYEVCVVQGKAVATFGPGSLANVELWNNSGDLGFQVEVIDWMLGPGKSVSYGSPVVISWINSQWVLTAATPLVPYSGG